MWEIWEEQGVDSKTELTVNFHCYASKKKDMKFFSSILIEEDIPFRIKETRTMVFLKGWEIGADITKCWTLPELQGKTGNFFILAQQTGVLLEGCGAIMPS